MSLQGLITELKALAEAPPTEEMGLVKKTLHKIGIPADVMVTDRGWVEVEFFTQEDLQEFQEFAKKHRWEIERRGRTGVVVYLARPN